MPVLIKIPTLRAAFKKGGTITAANSSSISDGAAALVMMKQSEAQKRGLTPLCKIVAHATHAQKPEEFTVAPVGAFRLQRGSKVPRPSWGACALLCGSGGGGEPCLRARQQCAVTPQCRGVALLDG